MREQFVTYEIALALKELGFDAQCFGYYTPVKNWMIEGKYSEGKFHGPNWANTDNTMYFMYIVNSFGDRDSTTKNSKFTKAIHNIAVPLWQQVIDWLDSKNIFIDITYHKSGKFYASINNECDIPITDDLAFEKYDNRNQAREQSILKALEIITNK